MRFVKLFTALKPTLVSVFKKKKIRYYFVFHILDFDQNEESLRLYNDEFFREHHVFPVANLVPVVLYSKNLLIKSISEVTSIVTGYYGRYQKCTPITLATAQKPIEQLLRFLDLLISDVNTYPPIPQKNFLLKLECV